MSFSKKDLYVRQTVLPEIGERGQEALLKAKVAVVGCGGLGSLVAVQLAASGLGSLYLIDYDLVSVSNLHRQVFYRTADVGKLKTEVLSDYILHLSPFVEVKRSEKPLTRQNIEQELKDYDLVVDCTDSLITKYLINDYCVLADKVLVYGSLYKHDGYVSTFNLPQDIGRSTNLRDAFAKLPERSIPNCSEVGTLNTIVGLIATLQTNEVIKIVTENGSSLSDKILIYNTMQNTQFTMSLSKNTTKREVERIFTSESYHDPRCATQDETLLIYPEQLKKRRDEVEILSVIEEENLDLPFEADHKIPLSRFRVQSLTLPADKDLVVVCKKGISSYEVTRLLKSSHSDSRVFSLAGGIESY
jgi:adenylyltransferase/sulfurtransferase